MESRTYQCVTPGQVAHVQASLNKAGAAITVKSSSEWSVSGMGIIADANYESERQTLLVSIVHKPMFVPESVIFAKIQDALDETANPAASAPE